MPYASTTGETYHDRRRCRRLHATGGRIRQVETPVGMAACPHCVDDPNTVTETADEPAGTCTVELSGGGECGRERPCPYHDKR